MQMLACSLRKLKKNRQALKEFIQLERPIAHNDFYREAKRFGHHGGTNTVYKHCISVGFCAYKICRLIRLDEYTTKSVVEASLLHDMFGHPFYGNGNNITQCFLNHRGFDKIRRMHAFYHGTEAVDNVSKYINLNDNQKDAIIKHMFPLYPIPPRHLEGWILTLADKLVATQEVFETIIYKINQIRVFEKQGMVQYET